MVGRYASSVGLIGNADSSRIYYVPLMFWFNRNPGLSLPLIALNVRAEKQLACRYVDMLQDKPIRIPQIC